MSLQAFVIGSAILGGLYLDKKRRENIVTDNITAGRRKFVTDPYGEKIIVELGHGKTGEWYYYYDKQWFPISAYGDGNWKISGDKMVNSGYSSKTQRNPKKNPSEKHKRKFVISNVKFYSEDDEIADQTSYWKEQELENTLVVVSMPIVRSINLSDEIKRYIEKKCGFTLQAFDWHEVT